MSARTRAASLALLLLLAPLASASTQECAKRPAAPVPAEVLNHGFFDAHPDLRWRSIGLGQYRDGKFSKALVSFKRAARYADKFSQSMVGIMYWQGMGTDTDRALGYAWMDLAAERGYHDFLQQRERYWQALAPAEREDAVRRGGAVFDQYADARAKPRLEDELRKGRQRITGSRLGHVHVGLYVEPKSGPYAGTLIPASLVYPDAWWDPAEYWCTQDAYWSRPLNGSVDVGAPMAIPPEADPGR